MSQNSYNSRTDVHNLLRVIQENPLHKIASTSLILGIIIGLSIVLLPLLRFKQIMIYTIALSLFHFLEFYTTSIYSFDKVSIDSFLIYNGYQYTMAHLIAVVEALIELYFFPRFKLSYPYVSILGLFIMLFGQYLRSMAMITAGESFSHIIADDKKANHKLITSGVYSLSRHPSYSGFFYWALGTQLLLNNPVSFCLFFYLLHMFFSKRIRYEEAKLVEFFGAEYVKYREKIPTRIPFV